MATVWKVRIADGVLADLSARPVPPLVLAVLNEWLMALCRYLEETDGFPPGLFVVYTVDPSLLGLLYAGRLIALFTHRRRRFRTWKNLWLWPLENCEIVITWLFVLPG